MQHRIVMAFVGADRPGLVDRISQVVAEHDGNWQESRLSRLAGQFAGIVEIGVSPSNADALTSGLQALGNDGLAVTCVACDTPSRDDAATTYTLHVLGHDRRGIVRDVSHALAGAGINVTELATSVFTAPMSGEPMFSTEAVITIPRDLDMGPFHERLDAISHELGVDIDLGEDDD